MLELHTLRELLRRHGDELGRPVRGFEVGGRPFDFNRRRALMGVINLSPDSAYTESIARNVDQAVRRGLLLARQGADFVDLGAESTLPGARQVPPAEQAERIVPVVEALAARGVPVSVESYHAAVLEAAGKAGAAVFNLTGGAEHHDALALAGRFGAAVVHCYVQGDTVRQVDEFRFSEDMAETVAGYFARRLDAAGRAGVTRNILDPGLGFYYPNLEDGALRVHHQLETLLHAFRLHRLGWPVLNILPHAPDIFGEEYRRAAEPFFAVLALLGGSHILRTHELPVVARVRDALAAYAPHRRT